MATPVAWSIAMATPIIDRDGTGAKCMAHICARVCTRAPVHKYALRESCQNGIAMPMSAVSQRCGSSRNKCHAIPGFTSASADGSWVRSARLQTRPVTRTEQGPRAASFPDGCCGAIPPGLSVHDCTHAGSARPTSPIAGIATVHSPISDATSAHNSTPRTRISIPQI